MDLGAESGRVTVGRFDGARLHLAEVHRFATRSVNLPDGLYWDVLGLYADVVQGLGLAVGRDGEAPVSLGVDAWGTDFGLIDEHGSLLANPWHYRDRRTTRMVDRAIERVGADELYAITGTQFLPITTACKLLAMEGSQAVGAARRVALIPDLFTYWLTGIQITERTVASTTQLLDARSGRWSWPVIRRLGLPERLFDDASLIDPGTPVGPLRRAVADQLGPGRSPGVVAVAGHDTASAVAAVPALQTPFGYISCGTWSLVGLELPGPITTAAARRANFTNEAGLEGRTRFLSNVTGMWLLQECRRAWTRPGAAAPSYGTLVAAAGTVPPSGSLIDPDHHSFLGVGDMPARIAAYCRATGQQPPADRAAVVRCIVESLACTYRWVLERAEALAGVSVPVVHLVGGGAANALLCQRTADVLGRPVIAGPVEATAAGNLLVQAMADGRLKGQDDLRAVVAASFRLQRYEPEPGPSGDDTYARFERLREHGDGGGR